MEIQKPFNGAANCSTIGYNYILFEDKTKPLIGFNTGLSAAFFLLRDMSLKTDCTPSFCFCVALVITHRSALCIANLEERKMLVSWNSCEEYTCTFSEENINGFA